MEELSKEQLDDLNINRDRDFMVQNLVVTAELGVNFPVTLYTAAGLISGTVISGKQFLDELEKQLTGQGTTSHSAEVARAWINNYREVYSETRGEDDPQPNLIHLSNAQLFVGGVATPTNGGVPWRGKIESVIGFHFGTLQSQ